MLYSFDYDSSYDPAIPIVEIEIRSSKSASGILLNALVDSGADATIIPFPYLRHIRARKGDKAMLRGTVQQRVQVDLYWVLLSISTLRPMPVQVVGDTQGNEVILGRDILNQLVVTLNGLAGLVEISD